LRNKTGAQYVLWRDGVYYFAGRIPVDMQDKCRLYFSLRTQSKSRAIRTAQSITQHLDDYWLGVRLQKLDTTSYMHLRWSRLSHDSMVVGICMLVASQRWGA